MKNIYLSIITTMLVACAGLDGDDTGTSHDSITDRKTIADQARLEADRIGNSGPIYDLYISCLEGSWSNLLASGTEEHKAYQAGIDQCAYELDLLCGFYGSQSCYADAELSNRLLFSEFHAL